LVAIVVQLTSLAAKETLNPVNYFSYFTIDSNLIAAGVLIACTVNRDRPTTPWRDLVRGGAVVYMSITDRLHDHPRRHRQPLPVSLPESGERWLCERRRVLRGDPGRDGRGQRARGRARERSG
jgi:hypothetical protein